MKMTIKEYKTKKILSFLGMLDSRGDRDEELTFINDRDKIMKMEIRENNIWYLGKSDELLNFYTHANVIEYNYEPFFTRNKRGYFWNISATENDIKRTHSGQPRNIVDTLVNIVGTPAVKGGVTEKKKIALEEIIEDNDFWRMYKTIQMPMTLVEGWGAYKITWDKALTDKPIIEYYRAENVDFVYKSNRLIAIIFKDYYIDEKGKKYVIFETRRVENQNLHIEYEAFWVTDKQDLLKKVELDKLPEFAYLKDIEHLELKGFNELLAVPCIFFRDTDMNSYGRSIYSGKIDLFDDLDQCLSQSSGTVRKSTPVEYFNTDFLQRDRKTGMPIPPKAYDRKYTMYGGGKDANGNALNNKPVETTQPNLNFTEYNQEATQIMYHIISGIMSPATLGIDIAKKDNAEAQREKEKVTVFTRNTIIEAEIKILEKLFSQVLCVDEYLKTGQITILKYPINVKYGEFADSSFENKLNSLIPAMQTQIMSPTMFVDKLYGETLSTEEKKREIEYIEKQNQEENEPEEENFGELDDLGTLGGVYEQEK